MSIRGSSNISTGIGVVEVDTLISVDGSAAPLKTIQYYFTGGTQNFNIPMPVATTNFAGQLSPVLNEKTFVEWRAASSSNNTKFLFSIDFFLVNKDYVGLSN
jgi:hypothetical protein